MLNPLKTAKFCFTQLLSLAILISAWGVRSGDASFKERLANLSCTCLKRCCPLTQELRSGPIGLNLEKMDIADKVDVVSKCKRYVLFMVSFTRFGTSQELCAEPSLQTPKIRSYR